MNCNTTIIANCSILTKEELIDEYEKLSNAYKELKISNELYQQNVHELKRNLQTALDGESFLNSELESLAASHATELSEIRQNMKDMRLQCTSQSVSCTQLETECEHLREEIVQLKEKLDEKKPTKLPIIENKNEDFVEKNLKLENEIFELLEIVNCLKEELTAALKLNIKNEACIEDLQDRCACWEENLKSKKDELEEKNELYESAQEKVIALSQELSSLKTDANCDIKRGNSLFAEVDDQRKKMKEQLVYQKKHYLQMKKEFNESQHEIRRLKRESAAMQKELQICTSIFTNADHSYRERLNDRISQLIVDNKTLEQKLHFTESNLIEISKENDVSWLDSMLTYCKNETKELKEQLHSCRLKKSSIESELLNTQQEYARWRFEALKSRCIIIDRESLLEENKIPFISNPNIDNSLKKIDKPSAMPNVQIDSNPCKMTKINLWSDDNKENQIITKKITPEKGCSKVNESINDLAESFTDVRQNVLCEHTTQKESLENPLNNITKTLEPAKCFEEESNTSAIKFLTEYRKIDVTPKDKSQITQFRNSMADGNDATIEQKQCGKEETKKNSTKTYGFGKVIFIKSKKMKN